jgi:hypothetical protein
MSIDYRDQVCNRPVDADGYELPPWLNPFLSDYRPELVEQADVQWLNENPTLPPITGGSPEPYEPRCRLGRNGSWSAHLDRLEATEPRG